MCAKIPSIWVYPFPLLNPSQKICLSQAPRYKKFLPKMGPTPYKPSTLGQKTQIKKMVLHPIREYKFEGHAFLTTL